MKIKDKIQLDINGLYEHGPINIVVFGDSVSHGAVNGYNDYENVYWNLLKQKLNQFRDYMPVNVINASIGGTTAHDSLKRLHSQALKHEPDLMIVCFGLNDVDGPLDEYVAALRHIFEECKKAECDTIFMTPNMLNTRVADDTPKEYFDYAFKTAEMQNNGRMDEYMSAAIALANQMGITVCDCYSQWKRISETQDVTLLLANRINHPTSEMHKLFADSLYQIIMEDDLDAKPTESTMYKES